MYKLLNEMPYDEFLGWLAYFEKRPYQWRDDLRTYHIIRAFGEKRKPEQVFPTLGPIFAQPQNKSVVESLKGSHFLTLLKTSVGDKLPALDEL